nr:hypothetical protein [Tanacetum cinerariifolium]
MINEIRPSTDAAIRNQGASIKTLEIQIRKMSKVLQERGFGNLPSSTEANQRDHIKSISTTVKADTNLIRLRGDQVNDLMPTIEEGEVIDEPMINIIKTRNNENFVEYPSFIDFDRKIHIDCANNLRFPCMIVENMDGYRDQDMEISFLENNSTKLRVRKQEGLMI